VDAGGERQVLASVGPADVEVSRPLEHLRVAVGRAEHHDHQLARMQHDPGRLDIALDGAAGALHRRVPPQRLLDQVGRQLRLATEPVELVGVGQQASTPLPIRLTVVSKPATNSNWQVAMRSHPSAAPPRPAAR
jgi:hypothetical protein